MVEYVRKAKDRAVEQLAKEEEIDRTALHKFMEEYDYLHREKDEILQDAIKKKKLGLKQRRGVFNRIIQKLRKIIEIYNWE